MTQKIIIAQGIEIRDVGQGFHLQRFLKANCDPKPGAVSVWTFPKGAKATHEVEVVYTMAEFAKALDTDDVFVVYEGHSRYGQGPAFGPANTPKVPDKAKFPVNPWGVHFRMGFDATDTDCIADLVHHSVNPAEYDLLAAGAKAFLPDELVDAARTAKDRSKAIKAKKIKNKAVCGTAGAWRAFDTCTPAVAKTTTARGDQPLKGRHFYRQQARKGPDEFQTAVQVGSAHLDAASLKCSLLFMASCSSRVHFHKPLARRRKAVKSSCKFLLTGFVCATTHAARFLEQLLIEKLDPMQKKDMKKLVKALNGVADAGLVGEF